LLRRLHAHKSGDFSSDAIHDVISAGFAFFAVYNSLWLRVKSTSSVLRLLIFHQVDRIDLSGELQRKPVGLFPYSRLILDPAFASVQVIVYSFHEYRALIPRKNALFAAAITASRERAAKTLLLQRIERSVYPRTFRDVLEASGAPAGSRTDDRKTQDYNRNA
jgi:hypothetical protein